MDQARIKIRNTSLILGLIFRSLSASAAPKAESYKLNSDELKRAIISLAPRVNFFRYYWKRDPDAQFVGGTVRDFALWVRGQLRGSVDDF